MGVALAAAAAGALALAVRRGLPGWAWPALLCAPVVAVVLDPGFRILSFHGFLHAGIVYRILAGDLPPLDPLLAGHSLSYPWAHHALVAAAARLTGATPPLLFAAINLAALAGTAVLLAAAARELFGDRDSARLASALGLYGLAAAPVAIVLQAFGAGELESRLIPIQKFTSPNSNGLGILCFAAGLVALLRAAGRGEPGRADLGLLFAAVLAAAHLYPVAWLALAGLAALAPALQWGALRCLSTRGLAATLGVVGVASALAAPYGLAISRSRSGPALELLLAPDHLARNAANLGLVVLGWTVLLLFVRRELAARARGSPGRAAVMAAAVALPAALFLGLHAAVHSEYKFLLLCGLCLALLGARPVAALLARSAAAGFALLWLLLLPAGNFFAHVLGSDWGGAGIGREGPRLLAASPDERALHAWILAETDPGAVFADRTLGIPVFAHRQLLAALDPPAREGRIPGWGLAPGRFLVEVMGHPPRRVEARRRLVAALLTDSRTLPDTALARLRREMGSATLYVVARRPETARRLAADPRFAPAWASAGISVHRLRESGRAAQ